MTTRSDENPRLKMRPIVKLCRLAALMFLSGFCALHAQTLEVTPSSVLCDETVAIRASGLQPNETVVIQASLVDGRGHG
jgi:uncharacterized lipoprotein YajG